MLHRALVRSKLENTSVASNTAIHTDSKKLEHIQRKFVELQHSFIQCHYADVLECLEETWYNGPT